MATRRRFRGGPGRTACRRPRRFGGTLALLAAATLSISAALPGAALRAQDAGGQESTSGEVAPLPSGEPLLWDRYRRVFFYQSEAARIIPPDYRPVAVDDLEALLQQPAEPGGPAVDRPQLVRAVYVAYLDQDVLRSERSSLDIQYRDDAVGQLDLGPVNLAISASGEQSDGAQQPRLVSTPEGTLRAVVSRDCRIDFGWSLGGRRDADGTRNFRMGIPRCGQSRILIGLPTTLLLRSQDGVARMLTSPPPEAIVSSTEQPRRWYEIEAGGLAELDLQVYPSGRQQGEIVLPVRQQTIDYLVGPRAVRWTMRLVLDTTPGTQLPALAIGRGRVSDVRLAGQPVAWTERSDDGETILQLDSDTAMDGRGTAETLTLTVSGASEMLVDQLMPLPWPRWLNCRVVHAAPTALTQLRLEPAVTLMATRTPDHWMMQPVIVSEAGTKIYCWDESPSESPPAIRISAQDDVLTAAAALRLVVREDVILGRWETVVAVDPQGPQPLRMQVEKGWRVDSVTLTASGRVIDAVVSDDTDRWIDVWPEADDVREGQIQLQVLGERSLPSPGPRRGRRGAGRRVPSTWFVRLAGSRTTSAAAIVPPPGLRWSGGTALRGSALATDGFSGDIGDMLGPVPSGALVFDLPTGSTPALELERPLPEFEADVRLALDADDGEVFETLSVLCRTPASELNEVRIRSGDAQGRPPLVWSIEAAPGDPHSVTGPLAMPVTAKRDEASSAEEGETWSIALPPTLRGEVRLIGRRRYPLPSIQSVDLPSVPQAATQKTSVVIGPRLQLKSTTGPVLRVPGDDEDDDGVRHLRYDPSEPASIAIAPADPQAGVALSWQAEIDYYASTHSGDHVIGRFQTDGRRPLRIRHDPQLRLLRAELDGRPPADGQVVAATASVSIASNGAPQSVRLHWRRPAPSGGIVRRWQPPLVEVQGIVLRRTDRLWSAADTFIVPGTARPAATSHHTASAASRTAATDAAAANAAAVGWLPQALSWNRHQPILLPNARATLWMMPAEAAWGLAAVIALLVFALAWAVALRSPLWVAVGAASPLLIAVAWPAWALPVVGFLVAPAIAAGLLAVSMRRPATPRGGGPVVELGSASLLVTRSTGLLLLGLLTVAGSHRLRAQDSLGLPAAAGGSGLMTPSIGAIRTGQASSAADPPASVAEIGDSFPVLIPVTDQGTMAGTKVYVPEQLYASLYRRLRSDQPASDVLLRRAEYRIRIGATIEGRSVEPVRIEAHLEVEVGADNRPVRLPLPPEAVREVEIVVDGEAKSIRWNPADRGILLQLPRAGVAHLRLSIVPQTMVDLNGIHHVRMPIPPVAEAQVTLDADAPLDLLELDPCWGEVDALAPAGRLFADLGPVTELAFQWRFRHSVDIQQSLPLVRRWWVHAAMDRTVIECEIDPPGMAVAPGEEFQLEVYDPVLPLVVSAGWSLVESEPIDAMRHRLVLQSRRLDPGPIRLMWEIDHATPTAATGGGLPFSLPSVLPVRAVDLGPTLLAIDADPRIQVSLADPTAASEIEKDRFLAGWSGYKGAVDRALAVASGSPRLVITRNDPKPWYSVQQQHLHVAAGRLHLEVSATVHPGGSGSPPMRLIIPAGMRVHRVAMDGRLVTASPRPWDPHQELPLPDAAQRDPFDIHFSGSMPLPATGRFRPPCLRLSSVLETSGSYLVTCDTEIQIAEVQPTPLAPSDASISTAERLSNQWVPRWSWQLDSSTAGQDPYLPGIYKVSSDPTEIAALQLTTLMWEDGRWSMETVIQIDPQHGRPDFLTVELPAQWADELQVEPAASWSSQPGTDEKVRLVQILPLDSPDGWQVLRIRGRLSSSDSGDVSVPDLRLLGDGPRRRFFAVPKRLTSDPVNWLPTGARQNAVPPSLAAAVPADDTHATYAITGRNWSAKMVATASSAASATATAMDIQLFPQPDGRCWAVCRWDLLPAGTDQVRVQLPANATAHAAWSSGAAAPIRTDGSTVTIPLNLSRLAQPLVLLVGFAPVPSDQPMAVPHLLDIPVRSTWVARYADSSTRPPSLPELRPPWSAAPAEQRRVALAESALAALEGSLERLAERPRDEVTAWLAPWLARMQQLRPPISAASATQPPAEQPDEDTPRTDADGDSTAGEDAAPEGAARDEVARDEVAARAGARGENAAGDDAAGDDAAGDDAAGDDAAGAGNAGDTAAGEDSAGDDPASGTSANAARRAAVWDQLDQRTEAYVQRALVSSESPLQISRRVDPAAALGPPDWQVAWAAHHPGAVRTIPAALLAPAETPFWRAAGPLLAGAILLAGVLFVMLARGALGRLAGMPWFWLLLMSAVGMVLAPIPVAVGLCLVAVTSPLFRYWSASTGS